MLDSDSRRDFVRKGGQAIGASTIAGIAGCLNQGETTDEEVELYLASQFSSGADLNQIFDNWVESVDEESDGRITIHVESEYGGENEIHQDIESGAVDGGLVAWLWSYQSAPELWWSESPFVLEDWDQWNRVYFDSDFGDRKFEAVADEWNFKIIGDRFSCQGSHVITSNDPVETPEDMQGMTIRQPEVDQWVNLWSDIGAEPSTIATDEIYSALQQGVVESQENPIERTLAWSYHEVQDYLCRTEHLWQPISFIFNLDIWNNLSEEDQEIIETAHNEAAADWNEDFWDKEDAFVDELEDDYDMTIIEPDKQVWMDAFTPHLEDHFEDVWEGTLEEVRSI